MNLWQTIVEALDSLTTNKLRSGLTILGIVIGVAAVIAMLAIGAGAQNSILGSITGLGSNLLFVYPGNFLQEVRNEQPLTLADAQAIADPFQAPHVAAVAPTISRNGEISLGGEATTAQISGVTPEYQTVRNYNLSEGEFVTADQNLSRASVVIVGVDVADKLFGVHEGITGETIRIEGQPFRIIGVLEAKGGNSFISEDNVVIVPFNTAQSRLIHRDRDAVDTIYVQTTDSSVVSLATQEVTQILQTRHRTAIGADDFTISSQQDFASTAESITGVLTIFLGGIGAISLLVGGIGIMNIMLVSVTERTKEIGLRKALGAKKKDILIQFLTESALLSFLGGVLGIILGWLISFVVGQIAASSGTPLTPAVGLDSVLLATLFATAVGLFFGIYPANRAANLQPVEALRHE